MNHKAENIPIVALKLITAFTSTQFIIDDVILFLSLSLLVQLIRFSAKVLTALCEQIEQIPISGVIVVGDGQAARSIALSGNAMKVPVLWAKGGTAQLHAGGSEVMNNPMM